MNNLRALHVALMLALSATAFSAAASDAVSGAALGTSDITSRAAEIARKLGDASTVSQASGSQASVTSGAVASASTQDLGWSHHQPARQSLPSPYVTESGVPGKDLSGKALGRPVLSGREVPLAIALRQVVPDCLVIKDNGVKMDRVATWEGGRSWTQVLSDLGRAAGFLAHVDWTAGEVSLAPLSDKAPAVVQNKNTSTDLTATAGGAVVRGSNGNAVQVGSGSTTAVASSPVIATPAAAAKPLPAAPSRWTLDPTLTLRENVEAWARNAGWTVVWEAVDYPIVAPATLDGEFASPAGPLARLIGSYDQSDQPLVVRLTTGDRVIQVRNKNYERTQVAPMPANTMVPDSAFGGGR